jgi:CRISPR-associated endonuclease Csn1
MKHILGLDLGTNSIGWALIKKNDNNHAGQILGLGCRILPMDGFVSSKSGREVNDPIREFSAGNGISKAAARTKMRSTRRLIERRKLRRDRLHRILNIIGFLPEHYASQIDFDKRKGQFLKHKEPKIAWSEREGNFEFLFKPSFEEMLHDFQERGKITGEEKLPYDWTLYYLRDKAQREKIGKYELAWLILHFNQKRGYSQLRTEGEEFVTESKTVKTFMRAKVLAVEALEKDQKGFTKFLIRHDNADFPSFIKRSRTPIKWEGLIKEFVVSIEYEEDGKTIKKDKDGEWKIKVDAPKEDDWTLIKTRTENNLLQSGLNAGSFIYRNLLDEPNLKIRGGLVRVIERKFYKNELNIILRKQAEFYPELTSETLLKQCSDDLYPFNETHRGEVAKRDLVSLILDDVLFYQRPLKSKKSLISDCPYEFKKYIGSDGQEQIKPIKACPKSHPLFQEFRLWQFIHNLRIYKKNELVDGKMLALNDLTAAFFKGPSDFEQLYDFLDVEKEISQETILSKFLKIKKVDLDSYCWNYPVEKKYPGNLFNYGLLKAVGKAIYKYISADDKEIIWHLLYSITSREEIEAALGLKENSKVNAISKRLNELGLDQKHLVALSKLSFGNDEGQYASYSQKAIKRLLPFMRLGSKWKEVMVEQQACDRFAQIIQRLEAFDKDNNPEKILSSYQDDDIRQGQLRAFMNHRVLYGLNTYQACYLVYGAHSEAKEVSKISSSEELKIWMLHHTKGSFLRNPVVEQVVRETLKVVGEIWQQYGEGKPDFFSEIHVELGREMKNPAEARKKISERQANNEKRNERIKRLLWELKSQYQSQDIRPHSPSQQEILRIFEDDILEKGLTNAPEEIQKIVRSSDPSKSELNRYIMWLEQKYVSPYTGQIIPLSKLFTPEYEIEHILPQSRYFDDSMGNKVICEAEVNREKGNMTAMQFIEERAGATVMLTGGKLVTILKPEEYQTLLKTNFKGGSQKLKKLLMSEIPEEFIERQLNDTRYITKYIKRVLSNITREQGETEETSKHVISTNGQITGRLRSDWGLDWVWEELIADRFIRLNEMTQSNLFGDYRNRDGKRYFHCRIPEKQAIEEYRRERGKNAAKFEVGETSKKRIDHRHHALDALVIACTSREHVNFLNNENAAENKKDLRYDLRNKLMKIEEIQFERNGKMINTKVGRGFLLPWEQFTLEAKICLENVLASFKKNRRILTKSSNYYQRWVKDSAGGQMIKKEVKQEGNLRVVRKSLHKATIKGLREITVVEEMKLSEALKNWQGIVDKEIRKKCKDLAKSGKSMRMIQDYLALYYPDKKMLNVRVKQPNCVVSRISLNEKFNADYIRKNLVDRTISDILCKHLTKNEFDNDPKLAFSPEGVDNLNRDILNGVYAPYSKMIKKVQVYEPLGLKFSLADSGVKATQFAEADKGTNIFFGIYSGESGKRLFKPVSLNEALFNFSDHRSFVPDYFFDEKTGAKYPLNKVLLPGDIVSVVVNKEELKNAIFKQGLDENESLRLYYRMVSFSKQEVYFAPVNMAEPIAKGFEYGSLNKVQVCELSSNPLTIKAFCEFHKINALGALMS